MGLMLEIKGVTYSYGCDDAAIKDVSVAVEEGSIVGVAGHNGAGKTTLLRIVSGMLKPSSGSLTFSPGVVRGEIAYVPDNGGFYPDLTALDNVLFRMGIARVRVSRDLARDHLDQAGLLECSNKLARSFSHGMKKRLAIACALSAQPRFVVLDESLNGIDPESLETTLGCLRKAALDGSTILISSHDLSLLEELCSSILIMDSSRCVFFETVDQLEKPLKSIYFERTTRR